MSLEWKAPDKTIYNVEKVMKIAKISRNCARARLRTVIRTGELERLLAPLNTYNRRQVRNHDYEFANKNLPVNENLTDEQRQTLLDMIMSLREIRLMRKYFPN